MDNFMDKLAQKLNAQEVIKANSQAEAAELRRLRVQMEAYNECLQEMRKLNQKSAELAEKSEESAGRSEELAKQAGELTEKAQTLLEEGIDKIASVPEKDEEAEKEQLLSDIRVSLEENAQKLADLFAQSDDFVHKENVKVYRNVQAVIVDELKAQTELLTQKSDECARKGALIKPFVIGTAVLSGINLILLAVQLLITLGII